MASRASLLKLERALQGLSAECDIMAIERGLQKQGSCSCLSVRRDCPHGSDFQCAVSKRRAWLGTREDESESLISLLVAG